MRRFTGVEYDPGHGNVACPNNGTVHWIITGGLQTGTYLTGNYWGGANDITVQL